MQIETALFADAISFLSNVMEDLVVEFNITTEPLDCNSDRKFETGNIIVDRIKKVKLYNASKILYKLSIPFINKMITFAVYIMFKQH